MMNIFSLFCYPLTTTTTTRSSSTIHTIYTVCYVCILVTLLQNPTTSRTLAQTTSQFIPCASRSHLLAETDACNCLEIILNEDALLSLLSSSSSSSSSPSNPNDHIGGIIDFGPDGLFDPLMNALTWGNHLDYETPIMLRNFQWTMVANWNVAAAHHPTALDAFGRQPWRRCSSSGSSSSMEEDTPTENSTATDDNISNNRNLLQLHQNIAMAYAIYFSAKTFFPKAHDYIGGRLVDFGLDPTICDDNGDNDGAEQLCHSESAIATTPWGLAYMITNEIRQLALDDGWNADGSYNRKYNKIPYQDWRTKSNHKYEPNYDAEYSWKPLLETNGIGYLTRQEHVTPHIGQTAKSFYLSKNEICNLRAPPPNYDYEIEIPLAIERTAQLDDDLRKAQIELFDNKVTLFAPLVSQYYRLAGYALEDFEHIQASTMVVSALYESTIVVWKEKVRHDLIRPTTLVQQHQQNDLDVSVVTAYADGRVRTDVPVNDWEPFVRTMPHSEYPSGSSCLCTAAATAIGELLEGGVSTTFSDDSTLGRPLVMRKIEGSVVEGPMAMAFDSWEEIATICGESRLWGGMHFSAAVPAGNDLCKPIGIKVHQAIMTLTQGQVPDFIMDVEEESGRPEQVRCPADFTNEDDDADGEDDRDGATTTNGADDGDESASIRLFSSCIGSAAMMAVVALLAFTSY